MSPIDLTNDLHNRNDGDAICWLRRDLRLTDHRALAEATTNSRRTLVVFVYDTTILKKLPDKADKRVTFISRSLDEVHATLEKHGSGLVALYGDPVKVIPELAKSLGVETVYANHDDEPYAKTRDEAVRKELAACGAKLRTFKDHVLLERLEVLSAGGGVYKVFTPYAQEWRRTIRDRHLDDHNPSMKKLWAAQDCPCKLGNVPLTAIGFKPTSLVVDPGEKAAHLLLKNFVRNTGTYERNKDLPSLNATSTLSPHLRFGTISIREVFATARVAKATEWENELIWREFANMLLANFPHIATKCWDDRYENVFWPGLEKHFKAWTEGKTGVPIVDAAMRCLNDTGWINNRLRMIVANFLIKDLHIDWKRGEAFFAEKLLDYDLASNVYNWQWCAGCAPSAQPYFRVFNPALQAQKYDPDGEFVKKWCKDEKLKPIVDHAMQSKKVIAIYKAALTES